MKKFIIGFLFVLVPLTGFASAGRLHLDKADIDLGDRASLQRGAKYFVNYCLSCHSAAYMRYSRVGRDLGITEEQVEANLMFTTDKIGQTMQAAMRGEDATNWFGTSAPDLSVVARSRGVDWLYTYLRSFYIDETRPFGVNNTVFQDVAMPHVLWELQGLQKAKFRTETDKDGNSHEIFDGFEIVEQGSLDPREYDRAVRDLVGYLEYMGEPAKLDRYRIGVYVLLFLAIFFVVSYLLKMEYWKDIH